MFTMKQFEQVSSHLDLINLFSAVFASVWWACVSSSSSSPPCCALPPGCSVATKPSLTIPLWKSSSTWSWPKPHPPQMAPWPSKPTRFSSPDKPWGQIHLSHKNLTDKSEVLITPWGKHCFPSCRLFSSKAAERAISEQPAVPELVLSLIKTPAEKDQSITDLSLPWAALVLLPHLR